MRLTYKTQDGGEGAIEIKDRLRLTRYKKKIIQPHARPQFIIANGEKTCARVQGAGLPQ